MSAVHIYTDGKITKCHLGALLIVIGLGLGLSGAAVGEGDPAITVSPAGVPGDARAEDSATGGPANSSGTSSYRPPVQALIGEGDCVSATSSAWPSTDPGFEGYWKYCITITWDVGRYSHRARGLSDISVLLGLDGCLRACSPGYFAMEDTVGASVLGESCTVYYRSEIAPSTFPGIPQPSPTLKFEPYDNRCGQCLCGTARVYFYSLAPPQPVYSFPSSVLVRFGRYMALGGLDGPLPTCVDTPNAVEPSTWGSIKALKD